MFNSLSIGIFSTLALAAAGWGVHEALHSPLFLVQVVEMNEVAEDAPIDAQSVIQLAAIRVGKVGLFDLDLNQIEKRLLTHPWIRSVQIEKRFPQTVAITPVFREPRALIQSADGKLSYVDATGQVFGKVTVGLHSDLPVLSPRLSGDKSLTALKIIEAWSSQELSKASRIDSIDFESEHGFRLLVTYRMGAMEDYRARSMVDLGEVQAAEAGSQESPLAFQLLQLKSVLRYLSDNQVQARQIWADLGKKIVVKIARRS